jgi:hypothetical protein
MVHNPRGQCIMHDHEPVTKILLGPPNLRHGWTRKQSLLRSNGRKRWATSAGFEPTPSKRNRFLICRRNHLAMTPSEVIQWHVDYYQLSSFESSYLFFPRKVFSKSHSSKVSTQGWTIELIYKFCADRRLYPCWLPECSCINHGLFVIMQNVTWTLGNRLLCSRPDLQILLTDIVRSSVPVASNTFDRANGHITSRFLSAVGIIPFIFLMMLFYA